MNCSAVGCMIPFVLQQPYGPHSGESHGEPIQAVRSALQDAVNRSGSVGSTESCSDQGGRNPCEPDSGHDTGGQSSRALWAVALGPGENVLDRGPRTSSRCDAFGIRHP